MMNVVITPPRIDSLEVQTIRIIEHHGGREEQTTIQMYPFENIMFLKQKLTLRHWDDRAWMPNRQFVATERDDGMYAPIEFTWLPYRELKDPLDADVKGRIDPRFVEGGMRKVVDISARSLVTLEDLGVKNGDRLHVWTLASLMDGLEATEDVLAGYVQVYFPGIRSREELIDLTRERAFTADEKESLATIQAFRKMMDEKFARIDKLLGSLSPHVPGPALSQVRVLRTVLPKIELPDGLEILFYRLNPTIHASMIRFFPAQRRDPPLLKLATGYTGIPLITNIKLLKQMLAYQPSAEKGAILLVKQPIQHPSAPLGTAWTLEIYEDGSSELYIGAPRADVVVTEAMLSEAFSTLPAFLQSVHMPADALDRAVLTEISAVYTYTVRTGVRAASARDLRNRMKAFSSFFQLEEQQRGSGALVARWKSVSNYDAERDPILGFFSDMFLRSSDSLDNISADRYVHALAIEYGLGPKEAREYLQKWIDHHADQVAIEAAEGGEKVVPQSAIGSLVTIEVRDKSCYFTLSKVDSYKNLCRILSLLEVLVSVSTTDLVPDVAADEAELATRLRAHLATTTAAAAAQPNAMAAESYDMEAMAEFDMAMLDQAFDVGTEVPAETAEAAEAAEPRPQQQQPETDERVRRIMEIQNDPLYPSVLTDDEPPLPPMKEGYFITQLENHDKALFAYTRAGDAHTELFSRTCQSSANKQPYVMSPESYTRIRALYGDAVHWVESPLSSANTRAVRLAHKSAGERKKESRSKKYEDIVENEKRALRLGFPLKDGMSVLHLGGKEPEDTELLELLAFQASKPLWLVTRAGTQKTPNYYVCSEYWCARDNIPLLKRDYEATVMRSGAPKLAKTCPFCGGRPIQNIKMPGQGETVIVRGPTSKGGKVAQYSGFLKDLYHPDKYAIPCCFTDPDKVSPPLGSRPIPEPIVRFGAEADIEAAEEAVAEASAEPERGATGDEKSIVAAFDTITTKIDYSQETMTLLTSLGKDAKRIDNKIEFSAKRILRTYIKESSYFPLEIGKIGIIPAEVDAFLGQNRKDYIETVKYGVIWTHPTLNARAFFRVGLGVKAAEPGQMIIQLIAYCRFAVGQLIPPLVKTAMTPDEVLRDIFVTNERTTFRAFQQANYGSLLHEFASPQRTVRDSEFLDWRQRMQIPAAATQRSYALEAYKAWLNFQDYVRDTTEMKDLRLWEGLFAVPELFSTTGVLLARITTDADGHVSLQCPALGVSRYAQHARPPILLLNENRKTQQCEPLIFFNGPDILLGVLDPRSEDFGRLHENVRGPLSAFYTDFVHEEGCARGVQPHNPWMVERAQNRIPTLRNLLEAAKKDYTVESIVRSRANRLVGVRIRGSSSGSSGSGSSSSSVAGPAIFIPTVDDGFVPVHIPCVYEADSLKPLPTLATVLQLLSGSTDVTRKGLSDKLVGLTPQQLLEGPVLEGADPWELLDGRSADRADRWMLMMLETRGGGLIPFEPTSADAAVGHAFYQQLRTRGITQIHALPWHEDLGLLGHQFDADHDAAVRVLEHNPDDALEQSYQHVRLTASMWLATEDGRHVRQQIELLRKARSRLPLYELRKRADLLVYPLVNKWIMLGSQKEEAVSQLRRDCLHTVRSECSGACTWRPSPETGGRGKCLIHAAATPRFMDPVFAISARLVDELLRSHGDALQILDSAVPRLTPPSDIVRGSDSLMLAVRGKGEEEVFAKLGLAGRIPTRYTRGYVYPEELGLADIGVETQKSIPSTWTGIQRTVWPAEIGRDIVTRRSVFWSALLDRPWSSIAGYFQPTPQYSELSQLTGLNILLTRYNPLLTVMELDTWYAPHRPHPSEERLFIILDPQGEPLQTVAGEFRQPEAALPSDIRRWLDTAGPVFP
jgi:hypothetical protein